MPWWLIAFDFKDLSDHEALPLHQGQEEKGVGAKASAFQYASHRIRLSAKIKNINHEALPLHEGHEEKQ